MIFSPLVAMIFIYAQIFSTIRKSRRLALTVHRCETTQQARRRNSKALITTLLILGTYTVGWVPSVIQLVMICDGCLIQFAELSRETLIIVVSFTNSLLILKGTYINADEAKTLIIKI